MDPSVPIPRQATRGTPTAFSLLELLCVVGIIGILLSLLLPAVFGAFKKVKKTVFGLQEPAYVELIQAKYTPYRLTHPTHPVLERDAFIREVGLDDRVARWLRSSQVTYHPFSGASSPEFVVIEHRYGSGPDSSTNLYPVMLLLRADPQ